MLSMSKRVSLLLVVVIITLEDTGLILYYYLQCVIKQEASLRAQSELKSTKNEIMGIVDWERMYPLTKYFIF